MAEEPSEPFIEVHVHRGYITDKCNEMFLQGYEPSVMCPESVGSNNFLIVFKKINKCEGSPCHCEDCCQMV